ncbi:MAG: hypothetical protein IKV41_02730 [Oscillospiraceae bacterium]|nr:hypothetical protein [Oscillospiraceae bacterium]
MGQRDRATGWQYAKLSGHKNEDLVKNRLDTDKDFQDSFLKRVNRASAKIIKTTIGGLHETNVPSVNGRKTKSKTDLKVYLNTNEVINISIKKSLEGQVYFVRAGLFIDTFEKQFGIKIPLDVQRAINLFWAASDDAVEIIEKFGNRNNAKSYNMQLRHESLNATTLKAYNEHLYTVLLQWFTNNAYELAKLSFSMGAVQNRNEWSDFVWYINLLGENDADDIFLIEDVCKAVQANSHKETYYGSAYGGTTIQLPFGFVQWHQRQLQFHHSFDKIYTLLGECI